MLEAEASWAKYRKEKYITSRGCASSGEFTYEKIYWRFIKEQFPDTWSTWEQYDCMKSLVHGLQKITIYDRVKGSINEHCNFLHPHFNQMNAVENMHSIFTAIFYSLKDYAPQELMVEIIMEGLSCCYPCRTEEDAARSSALQHAWCIGEHGGRAKEIIQLLQTRMGGSVLYQKTLKGKRQATSEGGAAATPHKVAKIEEEVPEESEKKAGRSGRGRGRSRGGRGGSNAASRTPDQAQAEELVLEITDGGKQRQKYFIDDVLASIRSALEGVVPGLIKMNEIREACRAALLLCHSQCLSEHGVLRSA